MTRGVAVANIYVVNQLLNLTLMVDNSVNGRQFSVITNSDLALRSTDVIYV